MPDFLKSDLSDLENYNNPERMNKYIKYFGKGYASILDYPEEKLVFYEDYQRLQDNCEQLRLDLENFSTAFNSGWFGCCFSSTFIIFFTKSIKRYF